MTIKKRWLTFFLFFVVFAFSPLHAEEELLEPDLAFPFSASIEGDKLKVEWNVPDGYYLYRNKIRFNTETPGIQLGEATLPDGKIKQDIMLMYYFAGKIEKTLEVGRLLGCVNLVKEFERTVFKGKNAVETLFIGPKMIPLIIYVLALLIFYEKIGLSETFSGLLLSHIIICLPFSFRTLLVGVASLDRRLEWSAEILGANKLQTFFRVILPQMKTGMIASFIFTFILSFNNVTMALFISGIGKRTLPVEMFQRLHVGGITPKIPAISFILSIFGVLLFIIADRTVGVFKYLGGGGE